VKLEHTTDGAWFWAAWRSTLGHTDAIAFQRSLSNLGACLRDAGALCRAWEIGCIYYSEPQGRGYWWRPGCGRAAP